MVVSVFLHGDLDETVYMFQPHGFVNKTCPDHVCKLQKAIYGLKQAPHAWNYRFTKFIATLSIIASKADAFLFVYRKEKLMAYILLYVDDLILTTSTITLLQQVINALKTEFPMSDLGKIHHFLGIKADYNDIGLFLS